MISSDPAVPGAAPGASLYSSAYRDGEGGIYSNPTDGILVAAQHIANQASGLVAAINHSYTFTGGAADGNGQLTLGLDWISDTHNMLNVAGMPNIELPQPPFQNQPFDDFNGITVARSDKVGDTFRRVSDQNVFVEAFQQNRTLIDLIAPGENVEVLSFGADPVLASGNSYSTAHVTGTVALLQQYGAAKGGIPFFDTDRHEVMKAVLLNSADKIKDDGTTVFNGSPVPPGGFLGMERTVLDTSNNNWLTSEAMTDDFLPLDDQIGAGHLNAKRAIQQFDPGSFNPNVDPVPLIGWDYSIIDDQGTINKYVFEEELMGKSFVSITMAWDRHIQFEDDNGSPGMFTPDATFQTVEFPSDAFQRIDLYLMPAGATDISEAIAQSLSEDSNLDHIFFQIPETGEYEFWVTQFDQEGPSESYAVAWWAAGVPQQVSGDFDSDGDVDGRDFLVWQRGNSPNPFSATDLADWQANYGTQPLGAVSVPEPSTAALTLLLGLALLVHRSAAPRG